ncbi:hypothetical protein D7X94_03940 [Acutalibacter sp. 1XD8-33]|uniref:hypothetical protein n=1 Tax=Acutalibacter sp. 1XD8-33 TaxID=2320081 RepID=UPI000EA404B3|nr:hypothetical protein [Acutalibacter sp. 1XD8-33]RKJ41449.1 hypothetical protein D7X94_03940 [Acutalibacter sp. 1XD8-33]
MKYLPLLTMGLLIALVSVPNLRGNPATVHRYNRRRVAPEDVPYYGKAMGLGTLIIGLSIVLTALLLMLFQVEALFCLILAGIAVGGGFILYAQFKYNKGIF